MEGKAASSAKAQSCGFIGGGQMASALIKGLVAAKVFSASNIHCSDANRAQLDLLSPLGVTTTTSNLDVVRASQIIIIAVKPHIVPIVLKEIATVLTPNQLIISIAAGVTLASMAALVPSDVRLARVMPNTPSLVGAGATGYAMSSGAKPEDTAAVKRIFESVGVAHAVPEKLLDAVTGVSGSGPAYVFMFIEALADGGVRAGLPRDVALSLATQNVLGAAKMVLETGKHPGQLKDAVASPGGTTIAAIHELEKNGFRGVVMDAVVAAANRATELSAPGPSKL